MTEADVEAYIAGFPDDVADRLRTVRTVILDQMPGAVETIRYGMPAIMLGGRYGLHYAGWKNHIALYPVPVLPEPLESEVALHRSSKDTVSFPHRAEVPYDLISRIAAAIVVQRESAESPNSVSTGDR